MECKIQLREGQTKNGSILSENDVIIRKNGAIVDGFLFKAMFEKPIRIRAN